VVRKCLIYLGRCYANWGVWTRRTSGDVSPLTIRNSDGSAMGFLLACRGAELERLAPYRRQGSTASLASLRLGSVARLAATGAEVQPEALEYGTTTGALRVLTAGTELVLVCKGVIQARRLLPSDNRRGVKCPLGQATDLDNP